MGVRAERIRFSFLMVFAILGAWSWSLGLLVAEMGQSAFFYNERNDYTFPSTPNFEDKDERNFHGIRSMYNRYWVIDDWCEIWGV